MNRILLIDDDISFLNVYSEILRTNGYEVATATGGAEGLARLDDEYFQVVICDVYMPQMNGIEVLKEIKKAYPSILTMMLTGEGSITGAVEAMEVGAYTYMIKPIEIDQLLLNIKRAFEFVSLHSENQNLRTRISMLGHDDRLLGNSREIQALREEIMQVAPTNASVLITGESGTGKEIIAQLIHENSLNRNGPMVKVNCAALAESVLESEIFGHEKGAFTGAIAAKPGRFELARGGTLFLDEISELSPKLQSKMLRVIQEKEFERVGGIKTIKVDFRLVAATNKDLKAEVEAGNFREDLYYRINVVPLNSPPLRDRSEDIPMLLNHYILHYCNEMKKPAVKLTREAEEVLTRYSWKGNVRELKNLTERLVVFSDGSDIGPEKLPKEIRGQENWDENMDKMNFQEAKRCFERKYFLQMLEKNNWNISATADEINMARKNLQLKIKQLDLKRDGSGSKPATI